MDLEDRPGELVKMSTVAARNIAASLGVDGDKVEMIEQAITDEFQAITTHFAFMIEDMRLLLEKTLRQKTWLFYATAASFGVGGAVGFLVSRGGY